MTFLKIVDQHAWKISQVIRETSCKHKPVGPKAGQQCRSTFVYCDTMIKCDTRCSQKAHVRPYQLPLERTFWFYMDLMYNLAYLGEGFFLTLGFQNMSSDIIYHQKFLYFTKTGKQSLVTSKNFWR